MAVETCSARVLSDGEEKIGGWILLSPDPRSVKISSDLEEKILLLVRLLLFPKRYRLIIIIDTKRHLRSHLQLLSWKGRAVYPHTLTIHHIYSKGSIYFIYLARGKSGSQRSELHLSMITADIARMPAFSSTSPPPTSLHATVHTPYATRLLPLLQQRGRQPLHPRRPHLLSNMPPSTPMLPNTTHSRLFQDNQVMRLARRLWVR